MRTYFTRHVTLPVELMGVAQLRMWRSWQRVDRVEDVRSPFPPDAAQTQIVPELTPNGREAVLDKLTLSAFVVHVTLTTPDGHPHTRRPAGSAASACP